MSGKTVKLSGFKAVLLLIVLVGVGGYRFVHGRTKMSTQGRAELTMWVKDQVVRPLLRDTTQSVAEPGNAALAAMTAVKIKSLQVHGPLNRAVVRVELEPSPALPAGTPLVRYYLMQYSDLTGWRIVGKAYAYNWYLAVF